MSRCTSWGLKQHHPRRDKKYRIGLLIALAVIALSIAGCGGSVMHGTKGSDNSQILSIVGTNGPSKQVTSNTYEIPICNGVMTNGSLRPTAWPLVSVNAMQEDLSEKGEGGNGVVYPAINYLTSDQQWTGFVLCTWSSADVGGHWGVEGTSYAQSLSGITSWQQPSNGYCSPNPNVVNVAQCQDTDNVTVPSSAAQSPMVPGASIGRAMALTGQKISLSQFEAMVKPALRDSLQRFLSQTHPRTGSVWMSSQPSGKVPDPSTEEMIRLFELGHSDVHVLR